MRSNALYRGTPAFVTRIPVPGGFVGQESREGYGYTRINTTREALAVMFALKKFRPYFLSAEPFILVTDYQALQYAFKKKDVYDRLARWLDTLAEYEFTIQYRSGIFNVAADYLS